MLPCHVAVFVVCFSHGGSFSWWEMALCRCTGSTCFDVLTVAPRSQKKNACKGDPFFEGSVEEKESMLDHGLQLLKLWKKQCLWCICLLYIHLLVLDLLLQVKGFSKAWRIFVAGGKARSSTAGTGGNPLRNHGLQSVHIFETCVFGNDYPPWN